MHLPFLFNEFGQIIIPKKPTKEERDRIMEIIKKQDEEKRRKYQEYLKQLDEDIARLKQQLYGGTK